MSGSSVGGQKVFAESDIRPAHLMPGQQAAFRADVVRLQRRRGEFVAVSCVVCGGLRSQPRFEAHGCRYVRCDDCHAVFMSPRPTPAILEEYYRTSEDYQYFATHIFPASEPRRMERLHKPRVRQIVEACRRHGVPTGRIVEIGAGFGSFCEAARLSGEFTSVLAIEPSPELAEACRRRGLEVLACPVEEAPAGIEPAHVVAAFEVIEHLFDPRAVLTKVHRLLRPEGLIMLTCPNVEGFEIATLGPLSSAVHPGHLNLLHPQALSRLVSSCGFDVMEVTTPGRLDAELVRSAALEGKIQLGQESFLQRVLIDQWDHLGGPFQLFLAEHGLSSHQCLVARRSA